MMKTVFVSGSFDDLRSSDFLFLQEAARLGPVHVLLWSDALAQAMTGKDAKFPQAERRYFLESIRYVERLTLIEDLASADGLPSVAKAPAIWAVPGEMDSPAKRDFCRAAGMDFCLIEVTREKTFPSLPSRADEPPSDGKKVVVTGCYDWLHTGHVRFFEEASQFGDLYVIIGSDANVRLLKGEGHPLFSEPERLFMIGAIRYVTQALVSTGSGWMDAEPEIQQIRPDYYVVNEDGDKPEKRVFCQSSGLEYVVLKRLPKEGLPGRESTKLRGF